MTDPEPKFRSDAPAPDLVAAKHGTKIKPGKPDKSRRIFRLELLMLWLSLCAGAMAVVWDFDHHKPRLEIDTSPRALLPVSERSTNSLARFFPSSDPIVAATPLPKGGRDEIASQLRQWHESLEALPWVLSVHSLHSVVLPVPEDGWIKMQPAREILRQEGEDSLASQVDARPALRRLYDPVSRQTAFHIELEQDQELDPNFIRKRINEALGDAESVRVTGTEILENATSRALIDEIKRCLPIAAIGGLIALILALQRPILVLLPIACSAAVLLWTAACAVLLGMSLNLLTALLPALLMALGLAYSLQGLCELQTTRTDSIRDRLIVSQGIAGITTMVGFASLALTPLPAVREFSILAAIGTGCAVLTTLILCPVVGHALVGDSLPGERSIRYTAALISRNVRKNRKFFLMLGGLLMAVSLLGAKQVEVGSSLLSGLPEQSNWRSDFNNINRSFGGATAFSIYVDGHIDGAMLQPQHLAAVDELQDWLEAQSVVGTVITGSDLVADLHRSIAEEGDNSRFPSSDNAVRQLLVLTGGGFTKQFFDQNFRRMRISVTTQTTETSELADFKNILDEQVAKLPKSIEGSFDGTSLRIASALQELADSQTTSLLAATVGIFLCLAALFTSSRVALVALWPNLLPVVAYFGFLGAADIRLSPATSVVGCIVLGLAVDDTIHFMTRFNTYARRTGNDRKAARMSVSKSFRAVTLTSIIMVIGCLSMAQSELEESALFGALAASALLLALLLDITVTPALLGQLRVATLWDALRMNIGGSNFDDFSFFRGLSKRQARLLVSMADFLNLTADTQLPRNVGEEIEVFVVLSGKIAYAVDDDELAKISTLGPGSVIGLNQQTDSSSRLVLQSVTDVRLLHYDTFNMARLYRRYPRIAAVAFKNLAIAQHDQIEFLTNHRALSLAKQN